MILERGIESSRIFVHPFGLGIAVGFLRSEPVLRSMAAWTAVSRQAFNVARLSSSSSASLVHRRGLAGGSDHHGPPKVNFWQDPMNPSKWKEEHFVIVSLTGWGLLFYGGYKFFTRGKDKKEEKVEEPANRA